MTTLTYEVQVDRAALGNALSLFEFVGGNTDEALRIAINKAGPKIKTASSRSIREQVNLKAGYVGDRLTFTKATRSNLSGAIKTPSRGLLLSRFSTDASVANDSISWVRPPPTPANGIYVKIKPTGGRVKVGSGGDSKPFYLVLRGSRALGIARRKADGKLDVLHGPSLSQVFNTVRNDVMPVAVQELQDQMIDAMRYIMVRQFPPPPP
jgi:hypothetical protein